MGIWFGAMRGPLHSVQSIVIQGIFHVLHRNYTPRFLCRGAVGIYIKAAESLV